jgi:hypothetical protein
MTEIRSGTLYDCIGCIIEAITGWPARYFFAFAFVCAALLLISLIPSLGGPAGISPAPGWFRLALTVATLSFLAIALTKGLSHLFARRAAARSARGRGTALETDLRDLTPSECAVLARYVDSNKRVVSFIVGTPGPGSAITAQALAIRGHLYEVGRQETRFYTQIDYAIQEPTFLFLLRHPELLQSGRDLLSTQEDGIRLQ